MPMGRAGGGRNRQKKNFFCPLTPTLLTPSPLPTGILYSPQFRSHQETKMAAQHLQSHGKIEDCEQSRIYRKAGMIHCISPSGNDILLAGNNILQSDKDTSPRNKTIALTIYRLIYCLR